MTDLTKSTRWRVGDVLFDPAQGAVWVEGQRINLPPRLGALLKRFVEAAPHAVSKEDLLDEVWANSIVSEAALTQRVKELRSLLRDDARHPRYLETLPKRGYRLVAKVAAESDPAPVESALAPLVPPKARAMQRSRARWALVATAAALLGTGVALLWSVNNRELGSRRGAHVPVRRAVAILGFANLSRQPEYDWLNEAFQHLLTTEIAAGGRLRVVSGEVAHRLCQELDVDLSGPVGTATAHRLGDVAGVDFLLTGTFIVQGDWPAGDVRLDLTLQETRQGEVLFTSAVSEPCANLLTLVDEAGVRLREALGMPALSPREREALLAMRPSSPEAARFYALGKEAFHRFNFTGAQEAFARAVALDPGSAAAHAALADAWEWLGYMERAQEESRLAWQLSARLPREVQLAAEQGFRERRGEWPRAVELARALYEFFPDNLDYGLSLASVLGKIGDTAAVAAVLETLRGLPAPLGTDPRIDLAEAWMADTDPQRKLAAADRAAATAMASGARLLLAAARIQQGLAQRRLGKLSEARLAFDEAHRIRLAAGDAAGIAKAEEHLAAIAHLGGDVVAAARAYEEAIATWRHLGAKGEVSRLLSRRAVVAADAGDVGGARAFLVQARQALQASEPAAVDSPLDLDTAAVALAEGHFRQAQELARHLLASSPDGSKSLAAGRAAVLLAEALLSTAANQEALAAADDAVRRADEASDVSLALTARVIRARALAATGDTVAALAQLEPIRAQAARQRLLPIELETLLAIGETHRRAGDRQRGAVVLAAVARRAEAHGLLRVAQRAESLLRAS